MKNEHESTTETPACPSKSLMPCLQIYPPFLRGGYQLSHTSLLWFHHSNNVDTLGLNQSPRFRGRPSVLLDPVEDLVGPWHFWDHGMLSNSFKAMYKHCTSKHTGGNLKLCAHVFEVTTSMQKHREWRESFWLPRKIISDFTVATCCHTVEAQHSTTVVPWVSKPRRLLFPLAHAPRLGSGESEL